MEFATTGVPASLDQVSIGECFVFEAKNGLALEIVIAYPTSQQGFVLALIRPDRQLPSALRPKAPEPAIVFKQALKLVTGVAPDQIRNGSGSPKAGRVIVTPDNVYVGFIDPEGDPSFVSIKTGRIFVHPINGPVAVFETWQVVIDGDDGPETVFNFKPAPAAQSS